METEGVQTIKAVDIANAAVSGSTPLLVTVLLLAAASCTRNQEPASAALTQKSDATDTSVAFHFHERCIFIKMDAGARPDLLFLFDTGASVSALDLKTANGLKLALMKGGKVEGSAGVIEAMKSQLPSLSVGAARVENLSVTVQDLSASLVPKGMRLDGILGYDFLSRYSVTINFENRTMRFSNQPQEPFALAARPTVSVPFTLEERIPRLRGILNGLIETDFRLDTGASLFETSDVYVNVTEVTLQKLTAAEPGLVPECYFKGTGTGGEVKLPVVRLKRLSLGEIIVAQPYAIVQPKAGYFARPDAVGFVSNNFLEKYDPVTLDYLGRKLYLSKREGDKKRSG
jgi:hypothetical protein